MQKKEQKFAFLAQILTKETGIRVFLQQKLRFCTVFPESLP